MGIALGAVGLGLLARGVTDTEFKRLIGMGEDPKRSLIETGAQPRDAAGNDPPLTRGAAAR